MLHGEAVSIGMVMAARLSEKLGYLKKEDTERIQHLLESFELPVQLDLNFAEVVQTMKKDKKREGDAIHMVLLDHIGHAFTQKINYKQLEELIHDLC